MGEAYPSEIRSDPSITNPDPWYGTGVLVESKTPELASWGNMPLYVLEESPTLTADTALVPDTRIKLTLELYSQGPGTPEVLNRLISRIAVSLREATWGDRTDVSGFSIWRPTWSRVAASDVPIKSITQLVVEKFSVIPQVEAVYRDRVNNRLSFWVFTSNDRYDDALMDILITREEAILDTYPQFVTSISFPPSVLCDDHREVVGGTATIIFER